MFATLKNIKRILEDTRMNSRVEYSADDLPARYCQKMQWYKNLLKKINEQKI